MQFCDFTDLSFVLSMIFSLHTFHCLLHHRPVFYCGGDFVADSGFVGSEGFPSFYKPNSKCTWRITVSHLQCSLSTYWLLPDSVSQRQTHVQSCFQVPEGNVVMLSFRIFDLEADSQCRYDYLDVYNGHSNLVQKLGRFCGTFRPGALISTTNTMMLEMGSDGETQGRGFVAYFSGTKPYVGGRWPHFSLMMNSNIHTHTKKIQVNNLYSSQ